MLNEIYHAIDPIAFTLGPLTVRWYGIAYVLGFLCAALIMYRLAKRWRVRFDIDALLVIMVCIMLGILLGARLGYCLFYGDGYYFRNPAAILAVSQGGMSFHGGLIGAILAGIVAAKLTHIPYMTLCDLGCAAAPLGLFFGRCANFINGELWGAETDLPWGVVFGGTAGTVARHPSQLYEAFLEGIVLFIIVMVLAHIISKAKPAAPRGLIFGTFLLCYGIFRFAVEFVRLPDAQLGYLFGTDWFTMGQLLSIPLLIAGVCVLLWVHKTHLPEEGLV